MESNPVKYDFVVVGSGVGGLVSAAILAMEGKSVLVLEKNHQIGGSLQVFSRDKVIFDTGVHYIGSLDKGENLHQIFKYLGILDDLKLKRLDEGGYDEIRLSDGKHYKHGQGYEGFIDGLKKDFPEEEKAILAFCDKIKEVCGYFPLYNLEIEGKSNYVANPEVLEIDAWKFVTSLTNNKKLQAVLLGNGLLYAGEKSTTPFYVVALIANSYLCGAYRLENGGSQIAKLLTRKIHSLGGKVLKHKEVVNSEHQNGKVIFVETADGCKYYADNFISNAHPKKTIEIFDSNKFRPAYRHRIEKLENTVSSFMLYLSFEKNKFPYINHNIYAYSNDDVWATTEYRPETWPESLFICTPAIMNQNEYADSMSVMAYMDYALVEKWGASFNTIAEKGERGAEYKMIKKHHEELMLRRLESIFPDIRSSIKGVYSSTPLTYKDYIGTEDGALYGIKKDVKTIFQSKINAKTKISNLYLTGQNIVFHGILGATIGALVTCFHFVDEKELIRKLKDV